MKATDDIKALQNERAWRVATRIQSYEFHRRQFGRSADIFEADRRAIAEHEEPSPSDWWVDYDKASSKIGDLINTLEAYDLRLVLRAGSDAISLYRVDEGELTTTGLLGGAVEYPSELLVDDYYTYRSPLEVVVHPELYVGDRTRGLYVSLLDIGKTLNGCGSPSLKVMPSQ